MPHDKLATPDDAMREYAFNAGSENREQAWLLTDYDVWVENPHYSGPPVPHPEYDDAWREADTPGEDAQIPEKQPNTFAKNSVRYSEFAVGMELYRLQGGSIQLPRKVLAFNDTQFVVERHESDPDLAQDNQFFTHYFSDSGVWDAPGCSYINNVNAVFHTYEDAVRHRDSPEYQQILAEKSVRDALFEYEDDDFLPGPGF